VPKGPQGQKRPADVIGNAVKVMRIATGQEKDDLPSQKGRPGGKIGGKARAEKLTAAEKVKIAKKAASKRWNTRGT